MADPNADQNSGSSSSDPFASNSEDEDQSEEEKGDDEQEDIGDVNVQVRALQPRASRPQLKKRSTFERHASAMEDEGAAVWTLSKGKAQAKEREVQNQ